MSTVRFVTLDLSGQYYLGVIELYIDGYRQPDIQFGGLVLYGISIGNHIFSFKSTGTDISCHSCYIIGDEPKGCIVNPTIDNPCAFSIYVPDDGTPDVDITITIKLATPEPPPPTLNCYIGDGVYGIDGCTAVITSGGSPGIEKTIFPGDQAYDVYILRTRSDCGGIGGELSTLQYYDGIKWVDWNSIGTGNYNGYVWVKWTISPNPFLYIRNVWGDCTKQWTQTQPCIPNWRCEQPLNGYENDGCGNRRLNPSCNPVANPDIINGTFDSSLNGWITTISGDADVINDLGKARLRVFKCSTAHLEQSFTIWGKNLIFDWQTGSNNYYEDPSYKLRLFDGTVIANVGFPVPGSGIVTIDTSSYIGKPAILSYDVIKGTYCNNSDHLNTFLWIDNVRMEGCPTMDTALTVRII